MIEDTDYSNLLPSIPTADLLNSLSVTQSGIDSYGCFTQAENPCRTVTFSIV
jgi:hypothetical protein